MKARSELHTIKFKPRYKALRATDVHLALGPNLKLALQEAAKEYGMSMQEFCRQALLFTLANRERKP